MTDRQGPTYYSTCVYDLSARVGQQQHKIVRNHTWSRRSPIWSSSACTRLRRPSSAALVCLSCTLEHNTGEGEGCGYRLNSSEVKFGPPNSPINKQNTSAEVYAKIQENTTLIALAYVVHRRKQKTEKKPHPAVYIQRDKKTESRIVRTESRIVRDTCYCHVITAPP